MAASAYLTLAEEIPDDIQTWMRTRLVGDMDTASEQVGHRTLLLLRGVWGCLGTSWMWPMLLEPHRFKVLAQPGPATPAIIFLTRELLCVKHTGFSRRREHWLRWVASHEGSMGLQTMIFRMSAFCIFRRKCGDNPTVLSDEDLASMLSVAEGVWPMPYGEYTSMDIGHLYYVVGVVLGSLASVPLGQSSYEAAIRGQGMRTQEKLWNELDLGRVEGFRALHLALAKQLKPRAAMPSWASTASWLPWPLVLVHVSDFGETIKAVGMDGMRRLLQSIP